MAEPIFVFFNDCAPEGHPYADEISVDCQDCTDMVLCLDEVMQPFFITGVGAVCLDCFYKRYEYWKTGEDTLFSFEEFELPMKEET